MSPKFSLVISHTPWRPERAACLVEMLARLAGVPDAPRPILVNDDDYRGTDWQVSKIPWMLKQWRWSIEQAADYAVFMTDDLHIAPRFWEILGAMVAEPKDAIGLLCNHPRGPKLAAAGVHAYRTGAWLVGPAYVLSREFLREFLPFFEALPDGDWRETGTKSHLNDDSWINEFLSRTHRTAWHPLPTIIEHRHDIESTVGHGDMYSRERVSWRATRSVAVVDGKIVWTDTPANFDLGALASPSYWAGAAEQIPVGPE